jgi:hypothetical protein
MLKGRHSVPASRLRPHIEQFLDEGGEVGTLAHRAGIDPRRVWAIRNGETTRVTFKIADRLMVALDSAWMWNLPADQGGFADIYEQDAA